MKINITGWFNKRNVGDEAFRLAHQRIFAGHDLQFITPPTRCPEADLIVLGGGSVVSPYYLNVLPDHCPRIALGVDIAYESEIDLLAKHNFQAVYIRNNTDISKLREKLQCPAVSIPDLAFLLEPSKKMPKKHKSIGVLITDYVNPAIDRPFEKCGIRAHEFKIKLANELDRFIDQGWIVYLIPCSTGGYGNDIRINLDVAAFMRHSPEIIMDTLGPIEMIDLLQTMTVNICMRFHAHIFSVIAGTPFVSIAFTRKVDLFLKENKLDSLTSACFEGNQFNCQNLNGSLHKVLDLKHDDLFKKMTQEKIDLLQPILGEVRSRWTK